MKGKTFFVIACMTVFLAAKPTVLADDLDPPTWRGYEGTTFQLWDFATSDTTPEPNVVNNPYGTPGLRVDTDHDWVSVDDQRTGIWALSGELDIYIPNWPEQRPEKEIWIQLTWKPAELDESPFLPDQPIVGVVTEPLFENMQTERWDESLGDGWTHSVYSIHMWPNPNKEWIAVKGDIMVDQVAVDTYCVPEPATISMLGIGALLATLKRRKARA